MHTMRYTVWWAIYDALHAAQANPLVTELNA